MNWIIRLSPLLLVLFMSAVAMGQENALGEHPSVGQIRDARGDSGEIIMIDTFLGVFPPDSRNTPVSAEQLRKYARRLPASIIELWKRGGFGNYGRGQIKIVNPDDYEKTLMGWLLRDEVDESRTVVALSSLGTIFYHRRLDEDVDDVSFLNPHTSDTGVCSYSGDGFLAVLASSETDRQEFLKTDTFNNLTHRFGEIPASEIFFYVPALRLGGSDSMDSVEHGDAKVHLELLLQLTRSR